MAIGTESNEVNQVGINPSAGMNPIPIEQYLNANYTPIFTYGVGNNSQVTVHTVTAGKTLHLIHLDYCIDNQGGAPLVGVIGIYNTVPALVYVFVNRTYPNLTGDEGHVSFSIPLPIPAGYTIRTYSTGANLYAYCSIYGYEL